MGKSCSIGFHRLRRRVKSGHNRPLGAYPGAVRQNLLPSPVQIGVSLNEVYRTGPCLISVSLCHSEVYGQIHDAAEGDFMIEYHVVPPVALGQTKYADPAPQAAAL